MTKSSGALKLTIRDTSTNEVGLPSDSVTRPRLFSLNRFRVFIVLDVFVGLNIYLMKGIFE